MSDANLLAQADKAFSLGMADQGLALLREHNLSNTDDAASWHRQAIIEEQIGDFSSAGKAHYRCIEIAPDNAMGYLYGGYWLQQRNQRPAAAALYSLAHDLDASTLCLWQQANASPQTMLRSREANVLMRQVLSEQHRATCSGLPGAGRIANAQWVQTSDQKVSITVENFAPELFFIPGVSMKPFYSANELIWTELLNQSSRVIKDELSNAMQQKLTQDSLRPYLDENFSSHTNLSALANSSNWLAIDLFKNGELKQDVSTLFPATLDALKALPIYSLDEDPFEVFFSFLKPNQSIAPHFGQSNHALTVHLPLDIPANCTLKVGSEKRSWSEGETLVFDDSFLHSAHNHSERTRVVLIFSIWHPDLTSNERAAVQESFKARQQWALKRRAQLQELCTA